MTRKTLYPKRTFRLTSFEQSVIEHYWPIIEHFLRKRSYIENLEGNAERNSRIEAWLSDCALALCESKKDKIYLLPKQVWAETDDDDRITKSVVTGYWLRIFKIMAFRRRVMGFDASEVLSDAKKQKESLQATEEFWLSIPQDGQQEIPSLSRKLDFARLCSAIGRLKDCDDTTRMVLIGLIEMPSMLYSEQYEVLGLEERTFYRKLATIRTRMSVGALLEHYSEEESYSH